MSRVDTAREVLASARREVIRAENALTHAEAWRDQCESSPHQRRSRGRRLMNATDNARADAWDEGYKAGNLDGYFGTREEKNPYRITTETSPEPTDAVQ